MIAGCPHCQSRYRIAREEIGPRGSRLRCTSCDCVFRVQAPPLQATNLGAPTGRVLLVEADPEIARRVEAYLESWGVGVDRAHDGADALLRLFRGCPTLAILGGRLPGVSAPVLCEVARRAGVLDADRLVRVRSLDEPAAAPEFEAAITLDVGDLPEALAPVLRALGCQEPKPEPEPVQVAPQPSPVAIEAPAPSPAPTGDADGDDPEIAAAERLARIIVSDIILYNEDKFARAAQAGNLVESLKPELDEGLELFRRRIPEQVRARRDFVIEELERRAGSRS